jgi:hypothetical protein
MALLLTIAVTVTLAVGTIVANAVVNWTLKFTPDATVAKETLLTLGLQVLRWVLNIVLLCLLALAIVWPGPVTRVAVFEIVLLTTVLAFSLATGFVVRLLRGLTRMAEGQVHQAQATETIVETLGAITKHKPD